jgi:hypothetical protein
MRHAGVGACRSPQGEPRSHDRPESATEEAAGELVRGIAGRPARGDEKRRIGSALHLAFGAVAGAAYGAAAEVWPGVTTGGGTLYGSLVWLIADEVAMPLAGFGELPQHSTFAEHAMVLTQHVAFGAVTEMTRRAVVQFADGH